MSIRVRIRLFAVQRELAGTREVALELADGADVEAAWSALVEHPPGPRPGRASLRFARNGDYAEPTTALADGDEVAMIPPVSRWRRARGVAPDPRAPRRAVHDRDPRRAGGPRSRSRRTARSSAFLGRTRSTPGTPAPGPGGRGRAPRRPARRVARVRGPRDDGAPRRWPTIADEIAARFGVERLAIVHRTGRGARSARYRSRWSRSRRIVRPRSRPPATRSTRPRRGPRSGRPSASPTGTSGSVTRRGPGRTVAHDRRVKGHRRRGILPSTSREKRLVRRQPRSPVTQLPLPMLARRR